MSALTQAATRHHTLTVPTRVTADHRLHGHAGRVRSVERAATPPSGQSTRS